MPTLVMCISKCNPVLFNFTYNKYQENLLNKCGHVQFECISGKYSLKKKFVLILNQGVPKKV